MLAALARTPRRRPVSQAIVDALFAHTGVIRAGTMEELIDVGLLLDRQPTARGRRLALVGNAGGPLILAADAAEEAGAVVPVFSDALQGRLRRLAGQAPTVANPVDTRPVGGARQPRQRRAHDRRVGRGRRLRRGVCRVGRAPARRHAGPARGHRGRRAGRRHGDQRPLPPDWTLADVSDPGTGGDGNGARRERTGSAARRRATDRVGVDAVR